MAELFAAEATAVLAPAGGSTEHLLRAIGHRSRLLSTLFLPLPCSQTAADAVGQVLDTIKAETQACKFAAGPLHFAVELGILFADRQTEEETHAFLQDGATQLDDAVVEVHIASGSPGRHGTLCVVRGAQATVEDVRKTLQRLYATHQRHTASAPLIAVLLLDQPDILAMAQGMLGKGCVGVGQDTDCRGT